MPKQSLTRLPDDGELIYYPCGCKYQVVYTGLFTRWRVDNCFFCIRHDPTLTGYAREHPEMLYVDNDD